MEIDSQKREFLVEAILRKQRREPRLSVPLSRAIPFRNLRSHAETQSDVRDSCLWLAMHDICTEDYINADCKDNCVRTRDEYGTRYVR